MRILVDADACPVVHITIVEAMKRNIEVVLYYDDAHIVCDDYAKVITVSQGADAVDYALINDSIKGDIIITQDYGVAAMGLAKGCIPINQNGLIYTNDNIDNLLELRALSQKMRKSSKNHLKGPKKRTNANDEHFLNALRKVLGEIYD